MLGMAYGGGGRGPGWGGPPPWAGGGFRGGPFGGAWNFPFGSPRGRAARGDVRSAVLLLLAEQPRHGYDIITELVERSEGRWQPSPGSVYPVLKRLAEDGLVTATSEGERRVFELTAAGRRYVDEHRDELGEPWADMGGFPESTLELVDAARQAATALWQVAQTGDPAQMAAAVEVLRETRRRLYRVMAGEALDDESDDPFVREALGDGPRSDAGGASGRQGEAPSDEAPSGEADASDPE
jgi:DNA-binding PadR family transcriptional regulator